MRVGARIREVLAILDAHGALTCAEVHKLHGGVELTNINKYLSRAESMGLAKRDRTEKRMRYSSVYDWPQIVADVPVSGIVSMPPRARIVPGYGAHNPFGVTV